MDQVGTKGTAGVFPTAAKNAHSLRLKACPTYGLLDSAKYSMNGTTIQSVSGDLSKVAQFQLRLTGSRDSHDTNGSLGADSLRQTMLPPELLSSATSSAAQSVSEVFSPEVIPNDKQKILSDRIGNDGEIELMTPTSIPMVGRHGELMQGRRCTRRTQSARTTARRACSGWRHHSPSQSSRAWVARRWPGRTPQLQRGSRRSMSECSARVVVRL
eukprot:COSAG01_NODE_16165_length_1263_cov_2.125430_1_plen_213_part_10